MTVGNPRVKVTEVLEEPKPKEQKSRHRISTMSKILEVLSRNKSEWVRVVEYSHKRGASSRANQVVYNHFAMTKKNFEKYIEPLGFRVECRADHTWKDKRSFYYMRLSDLEESK